MFAIGQKFYVLSPIRTRQFVFEGHAPIEGLPFTVIPDVAVRRICANFVRNIGPHGCWAYGADRGQRGRPQMLFTSGGVPDKISGSRLALLLLHDAPIPVGITANREPHCPNPSWCVCPTHRYAGTPSENKFDMYYAGRRAWPARTDVPGKTYDLLLERRAARANSPIRALRFFCEEVQEELSRGTAMPDVRAPLAA